MAKSNDKTGGKDLEAKSVNPFTGNNKLNSKFIDVATKRKKTITVVDANTLNRNGIFKKTDIKLTNKFNRYGFLNVYDYSKPLKEFLFFTRPDLDIFSNSTASSSTIEDHIRNTSAIITSAAVRMPSVIAQLQRTATKGGGCNNPFNCILSNMVTSKMDLPAISAESQDVTPNIYGTALQYRSHSLKSDIGFDFSLSFNDTSGLYIYNMVKVYDEYMRLLRLGEIPLQDEYIVNRIDPSQFSVYKFIVDIDGETILYYAKATGVYFTDVPRGDFGDPPTDGFKFSLSFHANIVEDNDPNILLDFNRVVRYASKSSKSAVPVHDANGINNKWASYPYIDYADDTDPRVLARGVTRDFRLKWIS